MSVRRGDVVVVDWPFVGGGSKPRPALVVLLTVRKPKSGGPDISVWPAQAEMPVPPDTDNLTLNK